LLPPRKTIGNKAGSLLLVSRVLCWRLTKTGKSKGKYQKAKGKQSQLAVGTLFFLLISGGAFRFPLLPFDICLLILNEAF
jgi:hypothetical protein